MNLPAAAFYIRLGFRFNLDTYAPEFWAETLSHPAQDLSRVHHAPRRGPRVSPHSPADAYTTTNKDWLYVKQWSRVLLK